MYGRDRLPYPCRYPPFYRLQGRTSTTTNLFGNWTSFEKKGKRKFAVISAGKVEFSGDGHDRRRRDRRGERKPRTCLVRWPLELEMDQNDSLYSTKESMFQQSILVSVLLHQLYSISANSLMRWSLIIKKKEERVWLSRVAQSLLEYGTTWLSSGPAGSVWSSIALVHRRHTPRVGTTRSMSQSQVLDRSA
jgi:hypothetical protein